MEPFEYITQFYGVSPRIGQAVKVDDRSGVIIKDCGNYIGVNFDDDKPGVVSRCHPTWRVEYLGQGKVRAMTRSQKRYQDYLNSAYYDAGDSFAMYLGIE